MQAMGANGQLVIDFETTPGTTNNKPKAIKFQFIKSNVKADQNQNSSNVITGRRDPTEPYRGFIDVTGDAELPLDLRQIGYILKAAFGSPQTSGISPRYTHIYKLSQAMPSFTLEQGFKDINTYAQYSGCKISKISFSFGGDNELTVAITIMGIKEILSETSFASSAAMLVPDKLNFDNAYLKEDDEMIAVATEAKVDIDFTLDGDTYCIGGGGFRGFINDGIAQISGNLKAVFENTVLLEKAISGTKSSLEIPLIKGGHSMSIYLPELKYKRSTPGIDGPKGVFIDLQYNAFYANNDENTSIKIVLVNDVESYDQSPKEKAAVGSAIVGESII